ncbi:hypothetical protein [Limimaricola cinnabarinus]|uniref:Tyr recombinase domain-containing protein n=1 Tax=Limimaricola cinnabarinus TaxID=1125964 RepID=A0A2G1MLH2_9RHOB|nr:hypothetical protein [Limimaricola cinnabarinus]PHP29603.1 hypothetical protein CJ301_00365 [Limimaricola cinnabarinus]
MNKMSDLLVFLRMAHPGHAIPQSHDLARLLEGRLGTAPRTAHAEFAYAQKRAAEIWGAERTAHFAPVLRDSRVTAKSARRTDWEKAERACSALPESWRAYMADRIATPKARQSVPKGPVWSAAHARNVCVALARWHTYCAAEGLPLRATGESLNRYATTIASTTTTRTAADYIDRILTGLKVVEPGFRSRACEHVVCAWSERAQNTGPSTKTGAQLVGARAIYDLGFRLMEDARQCPLRGVHAARHFRNGVLLSLGIALPQRARAVSTLEFDRTLKFVSATSFQVRIPARFLKLLEARKSGSPFERLIESEMLTEALREYRQSYRPIFDDGDHLFPSTIARGVGISEGQVGRLAGDLTERAFGVRVSLHRLRDNAATTASEVLSAGGRASAVLLDHRDERTTRRHYDHSTGLAAADSFRQVLEARSRLSAELDLE